VLLCQSLTCYIYIMADIEIMFEFQPPQAIEDSGDYYETLGVAHNADTKTIKKAYRKLSLKHHPDKNAGTKVERQEAHDKFVKIAHAFKVLSDPEQREIYDREGANGMKKLEGHPMHPMQINPFILLNSIFGGLPIRMPGEAYASVLVDLNTIYAGGHKEGKRVQRVKCPDSNNCPPQEKTFTVTIEPGFPSGAMVKLEGEGDYVPPMGGEPGRYGDLHVRINVERHPRFEREGRTLYTVHDIDIVAALMGVNTTLDHLAGYKVPVVTMPGVVAKHGSAMRLTGEGLPSYHGQGRGDLIVHFNVQFPDNNQALLRALGVPQKGADEAAAQPVDCARCEHDLEQLKAHVDTPKPCTTAGKIPLGDWAASKVLRAKEVDYIQPAGANKEL